MKEYKRIQDEENLLRNYDSTSTEMKLGVLSTEKSVGAVPDMNYLNLPNEDTFTLLKMLFGQGVPIIGSYFIWFLATFFTMAFAGHYGYKEGESTTLAGVALANMFATVTLVSVLVGMSSAVETLVSQNNGAENFREVGFVLQRSILVLAVMAVPLVILWLNSYSLFVHFGIDPVVSSVVGRYLAIRALSAPVVVISNCYVKYSFAIGVTTPALYANIFQNVTLVLLNYIFVYWCEWGYECLAVSWVIGEHVNCLVQIWFSWSHPSVQKTLQPWDRQALSKWWEFISLGVPGTLMVCSEWWAYEILTFIAARLGTSAVAAQAIILQLISLMYMIPLGLGIAAGALVGNFLGASKIHLAKRFAWLSFWAIVWIELVVGTTLYVGGPTFAKNFTTDAKVTEIVVRTLPILAMATVLDGLQAIGSGVLRGAGKQWVGATANIVAFYVIGIPLSWVLCFNTPLGVEGLMLGVYFGSAIQDVVLWSYIWCRSDQVFRPVASGVAEETIDALPSSPYHSPHLKRYDGKKSDLL